MPRVKLSHSKKLLPIAKGERLKKSVGAIHSSGKLSLVERKLANVLLYHAYDQLISKRTHSIPLAIMCNMLGWDVSNRMSHLKEALVSLQTTTLQFNLREDDGDVWQSITMLSFAEIRNGVCTYRYDEELAKKLFDPAMYAVINLQVQRNLDSAHALNLYENAIRFKDTNTGSTGLWTLEFFRSMIGATAPYYDDFRKLNAKVIKPSIAKINGFSSDIMLRVELEKEKRVVVALKFFVREKTEEEKKEVQKQQNLPGTSLQETADQYIQLRETDAFKALKKHGIADRLASAWIRDEGEQRILDVIAYTEKKDQEHQIKTKTSAYMRKLIEDKAVVGQSAYEKEKLEQTQLAIETTRTEEKKTRNKELEEEYRKRLLLTTIKALTLVERHAHAMAWLQTEKGMGQEHDYDPEIGNFKISKNKLNFNQVYLRQSIIIPVDEPGFAAWLQKEKGISLKQQDAKK